MGKRLNDHYKNTDKDFWNTAIAFTYKDGTLNESDINFLEKELILAATQANRYKIQNGNS
ncbi:MAG: GIY-YIG nuclease family protein [Candidatus Peribacteria bacterium]|nr:MAG: GIY-YIG nuclease family protein [Candidatus Peribacteria bacterium]